MARMSTKESKALRVRITKRFGRSLKLDILEANILADDVRWGEQTEKELFELLALAEDDS